ncbi:unnamed protein product [Phytomonas sp. EM1]|nr:unnamed protein product [Phytomonas sp. EM1]|eukprot:CCW59707.1 unnamed protein product [Phytomonas sp. isolate EM1]
MSDHIVEDRLLSFEEDQRCSFSYGSQNNVLESHNPDCGNGKAKPGDFSRSSLTREICPTTFGNNSLFSLTSMPSDEELGDQPNSMRSNSFLSILNPGTTEGEIGKVSAKSASSAVFNKKWSSPEPCLRGPTSIVEVLLECSFDTRVSGNDSLADRIGGKLSRRLLNRDMNAASASFRGDSVGGVSRRGSNHYASVNSQIKGVIDPQSLSVNDSYRVSSEDRSFNGSKAESAAILQYIEDVRKTIEQSAWKPKRLHFTSPPKRHEGQMSRQKSRTTRDGGASSVTSFSSPRHLVSFEHFDSGNLQNATLFEPEHQRKNVASFHMKARKKDT